MERLKGGLPQRCGLMPAVRSSRVPRRRSGGSISPALSSTARQGCPLEPAIASHDAASPPGARLMAVPLPPPISDPELLSPRPTTLRVAGALSPTFDEEPPSVEATERKGSKLKATSGRRVTLSSRLVAGPVRTPPPVPAAASSASSSMVASQLVSRRYASPLGGAAAGVAGGDCGGGATASALRRRCERAAHVASGGASSGVFVGGCGEGGANRSPTRPHPASTPPSRSSPAHSAARCHHPSFTQPTQSQQARQVEPSRGEPNSRSDGRGDLRSFASLRAAADAHAAVAAQPTGGGGGGWRGWPMSEASPSMEAHERRVEDERMRRARQRSEFLLQREMEAQTRAEVPPAPPAPPPSHPLLHPLTLSVLTLALTVLTLTV